MGGADTIKPGLTPKHHNLIQEIKAILWEFEAKVDQLSGTRPRNRGFLVQIPAAHHNWRSVLVAGALPRCPQAKYQTPK